MCSLTQVRASYLISYIPPFFEDSGTKQWTGERVLREFEELL